jgi:dTDP-4-amino-4,6-dideoxygalactose transaminase
MKYDNVRIGMNSRLDTLQAAILQVKLAAFAEHELNDVNQVAHWYDERLASSDLALPRVPDSFMSSWAQYTVRLPGGTNRSELQAALKDRGIPTMVYYPKPMHMQKAFENRSVCPDGCPDTKQLCNSVLSLPMGPYIQASTVNIVADGLKRAL